MLPIVQICSGFEGFNFMLEKCGTTVQLCFESQDVLSWFKKKEKKNVTVKPATVKFSHGL